MSPELRQLLADKAELEEKLVEQRSAEAVEDAEKTIEEIRSLDEQITKLQSKKVVTKMENKLQTLEYRQAFVNHLVGKASVEERALLESGTGGVVVPETIQTAIERKLVELSPMRSLARVISSASNYTIAIDAVGATASFIGENGLIGESNPTLGSVNLNAHKLATMVKISNELIADAVVAIEAYVAELIAEAIASAEGNAFINGDGVGQPKGLVNGVVPATGTVSYDGIVDMFMALKAPYRNNATFLVAEDVYTLMLKLKDSSGRPLMQVSTDGISNAPVASVLGKKVVVEPNLASGLLVFADFKKAYVIVDRQGMAIKTASERFIENDLTAIVATKRVDAKPLNADTVKVFDVIV